MDNNLDAINHAKSELIDVAVRFGPKILVAVLVLVAGVMVGRWIGRATEGGLARLELEPPVRLLLVRLVRVAVFALFAIIALQNLGVELLPLIAGLSIAGAGIALATQGILSNLIAGLTIIFTKPYRVGDYIEIVGVQGQVQLITIFSTTLLHVDRSRVVVPNRKVVGETLHNYGQIRMEAPRMSSSSLLRITFRRTRSPPDRAAGLRLRVVRPRSGRARRPDWLRPGSG
jgi:small conductance mechanosensitive channel